MDSSLGKNPEPTGWKHHLFQFALALFFTRFSILLAAVQPFLIVMAAKHENLLGNVLIVENKYQIFFIALVSYLIQALAWMAAQVTLAYGKQRFKDFQGPG